MARVRYIISLYIIGKSASAGAIIKNWGAVRKCVRNNYWSAGVRAPHSKIYRNPTSVIIFDIFVRSF